LFSKNKNKIKIWGAILGEIFLPLLIVAIFLGLKFLKFWRKNFLVCYNQDALTHVVVGIFYYNFLEIF
jgi:hypothetical protein